MLPKEQIPAIKQQLIDHINSTFPEDKKSFAINQIQNLTDEGLEEFLIQNKMMRTSPSPEQQLQQQMPEQKAPIENTDEHLKAVSKPTLEGSCVFCNLANDLIKSYKIDENKSATAILDIHPVTEGHTIIVPKKHAQNSGEVPSQAWSLAKKIARKLKNKFKQAKDVKIVSSNPMGHEIINVFPMYNDEHLGSERQEPPEKEMLQLQRKLVKKVAKKKPSKKKEKSSKTKEKPKATPWLPRRIP